MATDPETLAKFGGKPLLGEAGMEAIHGLRGAHIGYDEAENMHADEIQEFNERITELEAQRDSMLTQRAQELATQYSNRHSYREQVERVVKQPSKGDHSVYAAVLRAVVSDGQMRLWNPHALETADKVGRGFVEFDQALRSTRQSQPALIIEREKGDHANLYMAKTKRLASLSPTTVSIEESRGYSRYNVDRDALAIPVNKGGITALQIHPNIFNRKASLADCGYDRGPGLRDNSQDAFKLLLPQGSFFFDRTRILGSYDRDESTADINGALDDLRAPIEIAIGKLSVTKALSRLQEEFSEKSTIDQEMQPWFEKLRQVALGKVSLPQSSRPRHLRIARNFS